MLDPKAVTFIPKKVDRFSSVLIPEAPILTPSFLTPSFDTNLNPLASTLYPIVQFTSNPKAATFIPIQRLNASAKPFKPITNQEQLPCDPTNSKESRVISFFNTNSDTFSSECKEAAVSQIHNSYLNAQAKSFVLGETKLI